ncbi:MAG: orotidine-5'-phosphate decarboxylase [Chitinophagales bacterium]|jgi:orotidine-5'-phosphate decarboxylase
MTKAELVKEIFAKQSFLCVGLDTDIHKIPKFLLDFEDPIFEFNKRIIDATAPYCVAYKPNIAFYESLGSKGWDSLEKTIDYIPTNFFTIADAKRGDIGNTSEMYARTFFQTYNFDSITINPYMGVDSVTPFLSFPDKWAIILALTSNKGSQDFQHISENGEKLYEAVVRKSFDWGNEENIMFVTGATHPKELGAIRKLAPKSFFLVPGIGAQGGDLDAVVQHGKNDEIGLLLNSARSIIYASSNEDFAEAAAAEARKLHEQMARYF